MHHKGKRGGHRGYWSEATGVRLGLGDLCLHGEFLLNWVMDESGNNDMIE